MTEEKPISDSELAKAIREGIESGEPKPWDAEEMKREARNLRDRSAPNCTQRPKP